MQKKPVSRTTFPWVEPMVDAARRHQNLTVEWISTGTSEVIRFGKKEECFLTFLSLNSSGDRLWESFRQLCSNEERASVEALRIVSTAVLILHSGPIQLDESIKRTRRIHALAERLGYEMLRHHKFAADTAWDFLRWEDYERIFVEQFGRPPNEQELGKMRKLHDLLKAFPLSMPELLKRVADRATDVVRIFKTRRIVRPGRPNAQALQFRGYMSELLLGHFPNASLVPLARIVNAIAVAAFPSAPVNEDATMKELQRLRKSDNAVLKGMHQRRKGADRN
jgi:hypothetical protein